jgi:hypothetical protein
MIPQVSLQRIKIAKLGANVVPLEKILLKVPIKANLHQNNKNTEPL